MEVFADGVLIGRGPARPFESGHADAFVRDVLDGYFPTEFKDTYPDGVAFEIRDSRHASCAAEPSFTGEGRASGRKVKTLADMGGGDVSLDAGDFLDGLPRKVISTDGRVVDVRGSVEKRLFGEDASNEPAAAAPPRRDRVATLQVRAPGGEKFVLDLAYDATIGDLRNAAAGRWAGADDAYDVRTAHPPRAYRDDAATLESVGLVPTAVVLLQKLGAGV